MRVVQSLHVVCQRLHDSGLPSTVADRVVNSEAEDASALDEVGLTHNNVRSVLQIGEQGRSIQRFAVQVVVRDTCIKQIFEIQLLPQIAEFHPRWPTRISADWKSDLQSTFRVKVQFSTQERKILNRMCKCHIELCMDFFYVTARWCLEYVEGVQVYPNQSVVEWRQRNHIVVDFLSGIHDVRLSFWYEELQNNS